jgi:hypothetical protein
MTTVSILAFALLFVNCHLPHAKGVLRTPSFAEWGFERARHREDAHTLQQFGRYQSGRCRCRISVALVHHSWPLATFRMSMPIPDRKVRWGFLVLTGYALGPGHNERQ